MAVYLYYIGNEPVVKVFATQVESMNAFEPNFTYYYIPTVNVPRAVISLDDLLTEAMFATACI